MSAVSNDTTRMPYGIWMSRSALVNTVNPPCETPTLAMTVTPTWLATTYQSTQKAI